MFHLELVLISPCLLQVSFYLKCCLFLLIFKVFLEVEAIEVIDFHKIHVAYVVEQIILLPSVITTLSVHSFHLIIFLVDNGEVMVILHGMLLHNFLLAYHCNHLFQDSLGVIIGIFWKSIFTSVYAISSTSSFYTVYCTF